MKFFVEIPEAYGRKLHDQARAARRPPRSHAEWLLMQALDAEARQTAPVPPQEGRNDAHVHEQQGE